MAATNVQLMTKVELVAALKKLKLSSTGLKSELMERFINAMMATNDVDNMSYSDLKHALKEKNLSVNGSIGELRDRLRNSQNNSSAQEEDQEGSDQEIENMTYSELRNALKQLNLSTKGKTEELRERLKLARSSPQEDNDDESREEERNQSEGEGKDVEEADVNQMTYNELKIALKELNLSTKGKTEELRERLISHQKLKEESSEEDENVEETDIEQMTYTALRTALKELNLPTKGKVSELKERLRAAKEQSNPSDDENEENDSENESDKEVEDGEKDIKTMSYSSLRSALKALKLPTTGKTEILRQRLVDARNYAAKSKIEEEKRNIRMKRTRTKRESMSPKPKKTKATQDQNHGPVSSPVSSLLAASPDSGVQVATVRLSKRVIELGATSTNKRVRPNHLRRTSPKCRKALIQSRIQEAEKRLSFQEKDASKDDGKDAIASSSGIIIEDSKEADGQVIVSEKDPKAIKGHDASVEIEQVANYSEEIETANMRENEVEQLVVEKEDSLVAQKNVHNEEQQTATEKLIEETQVIEHTQPQKIYQVAEEEKETSHVQIVQNNIESTVETMDEKEKETSQMDEEKLQKSEAEKLSDVAVEEDKSYNQDIEKMEIVKPVDSVLNELQEGDDSKEAEELQQKQQHNVAVIQKDEPVAEILKSNDKNDTSKNDEKGGNIQSDEEVRPVPPNDEKPEVNDVQVQSYGENAETDYKSDENAESDIEKAQSDNENESDTEKAALDDKNAQSDGEAQLDDEKAQSNGEAQSDDEKVQSDVEKAQSDDDEKVESDDEKAQSDDRVQLEDDKVEASEEDKSRDGDSSEKASVEQQDGPDTIEVSSDDGASVKSSDEVQIIDNSDNEAIKMQSSENPQQPNPNESVSRMNTTSDGKSSITRNSSSGISWATALDEPSKQSSIVEKSSPSPKPSPCKEKPVSSEPVQASPAKKMRSDESLVDELERALLDATVGGITLGEFEVLDAVLRSFVVEGPSTFKPRTQATPFVPPTPRFPETPGLNGSFYNHTQSPGLSFSRFNYAPTPIQPPPYSRAPPSSLRRPPVPTFSSPEAQRLSDKKRKETADLMKQLLAEANASTPAPRFIFSPPNRVLDVPPLFRKDLKVAASDKYKFEY